MMQVQNQTGGLGKNGEGAMAQEYPSSCAITVLPRSPRDYPRITLVNVMWNWPHLLTYGWIPVKHNKITNIMINTHVV